ncbi:hypothetical protein [Halobaculum sp. EA56]|uniref:hypothetical protein n=1 Tax=Halobaculum sp. EA56 TaxID=3421648 RepID=UPI003EC07B77
MPATATEHATVAREDRTEPLAEALAAVVALTGAAGHVALGVAALTFLAGVLAPLL